jgi:uncharacterized protein YwqG
MTFTQELMLPDSSSYHVNALGLDPFSAYCDLRDEVQALYRPLEPSHRMLGYSDNIQGDMQWEAQMVKQGIYHGEMIDLDDPRVRAAEAGVPDWCLLLQLDTEERYGMNWGIYGRVYFWIRRQDLQAQNFHDIWVDIQWS